MKVVCPFYVKFHIDCYGKCCRWPWYKGAMVEPGIDRGREEPPCCHVEVANGVGKGGVGVSCMAFGITNDSVVWPHKSYSFIAVFSMVVDHCVATELSWTKYGYK